MKIPPWHKLWHTEPWEGRDNASNLLFLGVIPKGKLSWMDGAKHKELGEKNHPGPKKKTKTKLPEKSSESLYLLCWGKFLGFLRPGRIMQLQLWLLKPIPKFQHNSCWKDKDFPWDDFTQLGILLVQDKSGLFWSLFPHQFSLENTQESSGWDISQYSCHNRGLTINLVQLNNHHQ